MYNVPSGLHIKQTDEHHQINRILEIDRELDRIKDLDLLLERLLFIARRESRADAGTVYIVENNQLAFKHTQNNTLRAGLREGEALIYSYFTLPLNDKSISGFVAKHKTNLNIPNVYAIDNDAPYSFDPTFDRKSGYKTVSTFTFPLVSSDGELLGVMQLINARDDSGRFVPFNDQDEPFFEIFARFGSKTIQRAQMTRNLLMTITRFASLRDPKETAAHVNRVGAYSMEIYDKWARNHNLDDEATSKNKDILRMAAMLHDVGKVGISDIILKKPGSLSESEFRIMKSHTWIGARQFSESNDLNGIAKEVALRHHENWDGSGYPGHIGDLSAADRYVDNEQAFPPGFEADEIPLFARIVALADVYDALSSKRIYKKAWPEHEVVSAVRKESGRKFDPELVDILCSIVPAMCNIREHYPD